MLAKFASLTEARVYVFAFGSCVPNVAVVGKAEGYIKGRLFGGNVTKGSVGKAVDLGKASICVLL